MDEKKVEITLGKDGSVRIEAFGFVGGSCEEATAFLDKLFKGKAEKTVKYKDSYWQEKNSDTLQHGVGNGYCG